MRDIPANETEAHFLPPKQVLEICAEENRFGGLPAETYLINSKSLYSKVGMTAIEIRNFLGGLVNWLALKSDVLLWSFGW